MVKMKLVRTQCFPPPQFPMVKNPSKLINFFPPTNKIETKPMVKTKLVMTKLPTKKNETYASTPEIIPMMDPDLLQVKTDPANYRNTPKGEKGNKLMPLPKVLNNDYNIIGTQ